MQTFNMDENPQAALCIICEGQTDRAILAELIRRILRAKHINEEVLIVAAGGRLPIPKLVQAMERELPRVMTFGIVIDSDGDIEGTKSFLRRHLDLHDYSVVIAHPSLESWFGLSENQIGGRSNILKKVQDLIDRVDLKQLARDHPEFNQLVKMIADLETSPARISSAGLSSRDIRAKTYSRR
jgi:hypothetical protein